AGWPRATKKVRMSAFVNLCGVCSTSCLHAAAVASPAHGRQLVGTLPFPASTEGHPRQSLVLSGSVDHGLRHANPSHDGVLGRGRTAAGGKTRASTGYPASARG